MDEQQMVTSLSIGILKKSICPKIATHFLVNIAHFIQNTKNILSTWKTGSTEIIIINQFISKIRGNGSRS